jgi:hypothetical protein
MNISTKNSIATQQYSSNYTKKNKTEKTSFQDVLKEEISNTSKDYLTMSYEDLNNLSYEEYKKYSKEILESLENKEENNSLSNSIKSKVEAANYTDKENVNRAVYDSMKESRLKDSTFMAILNIEINGQLLIIEPSETSTPKTKNTLDYKSFFEERINRYQNEQSKNIVIENFSLLLKNLTKNCEHKQIYKHSLGSYKITRLLL